MDIDTIYGRAYRGKYTVGDAEARLRGDLEEVFGLKRHPKADKVWEMAWERGHSTGVMPVIDEYGDLAELLAPAAGYSE